MLTHGYRVRRCAHGLAALAILAVVCAGPAAAQEDDERDPISGRATVGFLATSGNTESTNTNARLRLDYAPGVWSHEYDLSAVSATRDQDTTAEAYSGRYTARRTWGRSFFFGTLEWNRNRFSAFEKERSETVGYGRRLIEGDAHALNIETGLGARHARRSDGTLIEEAIVRGVVDYEWGLNQTTSFTQDLVVESGSSNTSVETVSALRARLFGDVALVVSWRLRRNSTVPEGTVQTDTASSISLEYAF